MLVYVSEYLHVGIAVYVREVLVCVNVWMLVSVDVCECGGRWVWLGVVNVCECGWEVWMWVSGYECVDVGECGCV